MLLVLFAFAAERSEDCLGVVDTKIADGSKTRIIHVLGMHESYPSGEWSAVRAAAVIGVTGNGGLDDWYGALPSGERKSWWQGLDSATKTKFRNSILDLAA